MMTTTMMMEWLINSLVCCNVNIEFVSLVFISAFSLFRLKKDEYEELMNEIISQAVPLNHSLNPCLDDNFMPGANQSQVC